MMLSVFRRHGPASEETRARQMEAAGVPARYTAAKLSDYWDRADRRPVSELVDLWKAQREIGGNVLFEGAYGTGKTWLACALVRDCLDTNRPELAPRFIDWTTFVSKRNTWGDFGRERAEAMEQAKNSPILIVDDYGKCGFTEKERAAMFELINHRYSNRLSTLLTTNHNLNTPGDINAAIYDRLKESGFRWTAATSSFRGRR